MFLIISFWKNVFSRSAGDGKSYNCS